MIEVCSYSDKPSPNYENLYSYCCPECGCCDVHMIKHDETLIAHRTYFGKNPFWIKEYTVMPHKCMSCGNFYGVAEITTTLNKTFLRSIIIGAIVLITEIFLTITGVIDQLERPQDELSWILILAITGILGVFLSVFLIIESATEYHKDPGISKVVRILHDGEPDWTRFDKNNKKLKLDIYKF